MLHRNILYFNKIKNNVLQQLIVRQKKMTLTSQIIPTETQIAQLKKNSKTNLL